jgi:hypothetical protein
LFALALLLTGNHIHLGLHIFSDRVSVPVALGNYEDKIELLTSISEGEQLGGVAITLMGLNATRQQFLVHARDNVARIVIIASNGRSRFVP